MTISRKLSSLVAVVVLAGGSLAACGGSESSGGGPGPQEPAGGQTAITQANFTEVLGDSQAKAKSTHVTMSIEAGGQTIEAEGDVAVGSSPADSSMAMTMDAGGSNQFDMRLVDQTFYMNMGQMTEGKFIKIDLTDESNPFAKQYSQLMDQMDPSKQLDQLKEAVTSFERKGKAQKIDGVDAQPYVVTVDTTKLAAVLDLPEAAKGQVPDTMVYTMYVGSDNLPRRMETELAGAKTTIDYSQWGEPVEIEAPPAGEISDKDISELGGASA